jgi:hypothetical protein
MSETPQLATPLPDPFTSSKRTLKLRTIIIQCLLVVLVALGIYYFTRSHSSILVIQTPSSGLTITLNGQPTTTRTTSRGTEISILSGQYRLQISKPGTTAFVQDVTIKPDTVVAVRPVFSLIAKGDTGAGPISFVRPIPGKQVVYYLGNAGQSIYALDTTNQSQFAISERSVVPISNINWPSAANVALVTRADGIYLLELQKYNFRTQTFRKVSDNQITEAVWDPNNDRIAAALARPNGERSLVLTDRSFTTLDRKVSLAGFTNPRLVWSPNSKYIAVINRSSDATQNNLWIYQLATGDFTAVTKDGGVSGISFSPDEKNVLIERAGQNLAVHNIIGGSETAISEQGTAAQSAWRDGSHFYLPGSSGSFKLFSTSNTYTAVNYSSSTSDSVQGMFYFTSTHSLVFYTEQAVYTVNVE